MLKVERYAPPKRSITPEESTFAGEAVVAGDGATNVSTGAKHITGQRARHTKENETLSEQYRPQNSSKVDNHSSRNVCSSPANSSDPGLSPWEGGGGTGDVGPTSKPADSTLF